MSKKHDRVRCCPVCLSGVEKTRLGNISQHFDSLRRGVCPASSEPYEITVDLPEVAS